LRFIDAVYIAECEKEVEEAEEDEKERKKMTRKLQMESTE